LGVTCRDKPPGGRIRFVRQRWIGGPAATVRTIASPSFKAPSSPSVVQPLNFGVITR
jgi:hypothetical protein